MTQYGFFFDQSRCTGCQTCSVACKNCHELPPGPLKYLRIYQYEKGSFPDVRLHTQWVPCYHCEKPACVDTCVGSARMFGDMDNPEDPVTQLVMSGVARPLMPHIGTKPNVYYIDDLKRRG